MAEVARTVQVAKEMAGCGIEVLEISETRWKWVGSRTLQSGERVVYAGGEEVQ